MGSKKIELLPKYNPKSVIERIKGWIANQIPSVETDMNANMYVNQDTGEENNVEALRQLWLENEAIKAQQEELNKLGNSQNLQIEPQYRRY